ncbi:DUF4395 domain-containing protein [Rhodococcus sp. AD45-ID]|jgi:hypothetical protein|uniref:DUF4395 domain-containing protein n=1 Tax=Rhodococcus globerulus TaxID=33008 RepID=A0ABU4BNL3_RHOGO|nr:MULTISPECIES: DUF4395 domain-containing protein [Rhodococcus]KJF21020.1 hypothetical protein SZ00_04219 [Rhodococcus sp. AD45]MCE4264535.1 DUF4395 domain-containing protein [Rhodococcus globerulus]MDV6265817.1 DUF4395 domain-containing protein [Rhodococcus globerulus]MDV8066866.1 DUF4395 domain-containing protein [Rhodococcus sp. IEGM 1366]PSR38565.1 DUF4395 domain-containing protein [Rhodococcus sp. AD45-ID]
MSTTTSQSEQVDVRGPRFAAWITTAILVLTLILSTFSLPAATALLALQAIVFAIGAVTGPKRSPYGLIFGKLVAPRISPVREREPVAPLRFAQFVGFVFALAGTVGFLAGSTVVGTVATGFALFAALLNAAFGICLGCQIYPLVTRFRTIGRATTA